ncbi:unnamed protein product [Periconia digitata]|uniref:Uncharacterized protein n=1 Tax=Periconia digitata TaxID=1303443 RepID=A0A9W4U539_9PLEO|nr:unnamed protein product [Periconia digitata]
MNKPRNWKLTRDTLQNLGMSAGSFQEREQAPRYLARDFHGSLIITHCRLGWFGLVAAPTVPVSGVQRINTSKECALSVVNTPNQTTTPNSGNFGMPRIPTTPHPASPDFFLSESTVAKMHH